MDFTKKMDEAIDLFKELAKAATRKAKLAALEEIKDNEIADKLLELLKDEAVRVVDLVLPEGLQRNDSRQRLKNFVDFVRAIEKVSGQDLDASVFAYVLRYVDKEELEMYKAILTNAISLPSTKEVVKEVEVEEVKEVQKEKVESK
jgi:CRISPR/Cas system-associated protein Cas5 (RAMP superfamily)